ncbi:MAG TPA: PHB depolymerase family esterase [Planctomycetota bacterium]|nr:PHB depolymerase family esterase [Planctomycetota bacterium]
MSFRKRSILGRTVPFFVPRPYAPDRHWPLVVFLNGIGENGSDGERHLKVGLPARMTDEFPAIGVFPQCGGPWKFVGPDEEVVLGAVAAAKKEFRIDPARVYLTGISQGGCSTFDLGARHPELWAALVPVCGAGYPEDAPRIRAPLWIFHGEKDPAVPPSGPHGWDPKNVGGRDMARLISHAKYTEYPGADHFIWDRVYAEPELWEWLWAQKRS